MGPKATGQNLDYACYYPEESTAATVVLAIAAAINGKDSDDELFGNS